MAYKQTLGKAGEKIAEHFLKENGYSIIETNFRCRLGEIDIIAAEGDYLVFVEVKTRRNLLYGFPVESINRKKINSIIKTAQAYLKLKNIKNINLRFDVVEVIMDNKKGEEQKEVKLIRNAFNA